MIGLLLFLLPTLGPRSMYQIGAFEALKVGQYDGTRQIGDLTARGDLGLGTFNGLDGEMIVLDGKIYHGTAFGDLDQPPSTTRTPFACVVRFRPDVQFRVDGRMTSDELQRRIDAAAGAGSRMIAIRIDGRFADLVTRAYPPQLKPYLPFAQLTGREARFSFPRTDGTFVGFRLPKSVGSMNVPGYHYHFVTADRRHGGHVLSFNVDKAVVRIMFIDRIVR